LSVGRSIEPDLPKKINPCILQWLNFGRAEGRIFEVEKSAFSNPWEEVTSMFGKTSLGTSG
jgi:hypothetical protein